MAKRKFAIFDYVKNKNEIELKWNFLKQMIAKPFLGKMSWWFMDSSPVFGENYARRTRNTGL